MGQGGYLTLVNCTEHDWIAKDRHTYQMNEWNFGNLQAGKAHRFYIEFESHNPNNDDHGDIAFEMSGIKGRFEIIAKARPRFILKIVYRDFAPEGEVIGVERDLGWHHNGMIIYALSGPSKKFIAPIVPGCYQAVG